MGLALSGRGGSQVQMCREERPLLASLPHPRGQPGPWGLLPAPPQPGAPFQPHRLVATPFVNPQVWCGSYRPEFAIQSIKTDVHSPLKYRQVLPPTGKCSRPHPCPDPPRRPSQALLSTRRPQGAGLTAEPGCLR